MRIMGWIVGWKFRLSAAKSFEMWWPGTELNHSTVFRILDFGYLVENM